MNRRAAAVLLATTAGLLTLAWRVLPASSPPVYDGLCIASPYVTLGSSPPPSAASKSYPAATDFATSEIVTAESPPQAQVLMTDGTFVSQSPFTISVTPVAPAPAPAGMAVDGNVYEMKAVAASGPALQPQPQHPVTVLLRATSSATTRTMYRFDGKAWVALKTFSAGCGDTFEAVSDQMGDFALLTSSTGSGGGGDGLAPGSGGGFPVAALVGVLIVVLLGTTIGLLRLNRTRRR